MAIATSSRLFLERCTARGELPWPVCSTRFIRTFAEKRCAQESIGK